MDEFMAKDDLLNKGDLETNVLNALKMNGGTYAMPAGFNVRAFVGDGDALAQADFDEATWTWEQFVTMSKAIMQREQQSGKERRFAMADMPPDVLLQEMVVDNYAKFVDADAKKASFDSPEFVSLLKQVNQFYADKVMTAEPADTGKQLFYSTVVQSPADIIDGLHAYFAHPRVVTKPHIGDASGMRIIPVMQYAIQAKSPAKEAAWKFIAFLLSEEGQTVEGKAGFSLLKSVNDKQLDDLAEQVKSGSRKLPNGQIATASDEEFARFKELLPRHDELCAAGRQIGRDRRGGGYYYWRAKDGGGSGKADPKPRHDRSERVSAPIGIDEGTARAAGCFFVPAAGRSVTATLSR